MLRPGVAFDGSTKGALNFPSTYKYEPNSEKYYGEDPRVERRTPTWYEFSLEYGMRKLSYKRAEIKQASGGCDNTVKVWKLCNGIWKMDCIPALQMHTDWVCDNWNGKVLYDFKVPVWRVYWSLTRNLLAVAAGDNSVCIWMLLEVPGLLFLSMYTLLLSRSWPINKLRTTYVSVNVGVYVIQACIWIYLSVDDSITVHFVRKLFIAGLCSSIHCLISQTCVLEIETLLSFQHL
ncbi:putative transcription factor WD40-like family [Helianthus anomalus]